MPVYGEIRKRRDDGVEISVFYDRATKQEARNTKGEKVFTYKCFPKLAGNYSHNLGNLAISLKGTIAAPAAMLKKLLTTR